MKTSDEWVKQYKAERSNPDRKLLFGDGSLIKAIQLDAVKHGMTLAAEELFKTWEVSPVYVSADALYHMSKKAILTARDNLKELP